MSELNLTEDSFDNTVLQSEKLVFVDFWAPWCGPCKLMSPVIDELATELTDVVIGKVNVDEHSALAQRYNILSIPTFILFKGGQVVDQFSGSMTKDVLKEKISAHL